MIFTQITYLEERLNYHEVRKPYSLRIVIQRNKLVFTNDKKQSKNQD